MFGNLIVCHLTFQNVNLAVHLKFALSCVGFQFLHAINFGHSDVLPTESGSDDSSMDLLIGLVRFKQNNLFIFVKNNVIKFNLTEVVKIM